MSPVIQESCRSQQIVQMGHMLLIKSWRKKARIAAGKATPSDVPAGHLAVCVGTSKKRFIMRTSYLNHPIFRRLLIQAEEEYGFCNHGPIAIPCDESEFEEAIRIVSGTEPGRSGRLLLVKDIFRRCNSGESSPLPYGWLDY